MNIFTFWDGTEIPVYLKLCLDTWKFSYIILNYNNLNNYTDLVVDARLKRFTMPQIADVVRVHVLRDQGGYWLDADTIMLTDELPKTNMIGNYYTKSNSIGYLYTEKNSAMYKDWALFQQSVINRNDTPKQWNVMGNAFTDKYLKEHPEITVEDLTEHWPETYMITDNRSRYLKYQKFYFEDNYTLQDIKPTNMLMLHNSWTPDWYKKLSKSELLSKDCTLSNILGELTCNI